MPKTRVRVPLGPFTGGLNEDEAPNALQPEDLRIARNIYWEGRALAARYGATALQTTAINSGEPGVGVWQLSRSQGANLDNLAVFGNKLYKDAEAATPTDISGAVTITSGANNLVTFTHFNDLAIMCNGVDNPWKWSGSGNAAALGGTPPVFRTMAAKWNRCFGAGHAAAPRTIRYSDRGDPETWGAASTVAAILGDSSSAIEGRDYIQQIDHLGDSLFVGLANSLGRVLFTGDSTTPFRYVQLAEFGIDGPKTYVPIGSNGYFLSRHGVHFVRQSDLQLTVESSLVSGRRLRGFFEDISKARVQYSYGTLYRTVKGNTIILWPVTLGAAAAHNAVLLMDVTDGPGSERFAVWTGWDANSMGVVRNATSQADRLFFTTTDGFVWEGDNGTSDNGAAYLAEAATRWEDFGAPSEKKNLRDIYVEARQSGSHNLYIDIIYDYNTTVTQTRTVWLAGATQAAWGTAVWNTDRWPTQGYIRDFLIGVDDGVVMSFRIYTAGADQPWTVYKVVPAVEAVGEAAEASA